MTYWLYLVKSFHVLRLAAGRGVPGRAAGRRQQRQRRGERAGAGGAAGDLEQEQVRREVPPGQHGRRPEAEDPLADRPAARHAEGDVQGAAARGEDAARDQSHQRCQDHGGGLHHQRRAGCQHAQGCGAARGEGGGEQEGAALQAEATQKSIG